MINNKLKEQNRLLLLAHTDTRFILTAIR